MRSSVLLLMLAVMCALFASQADARHLRRLEGGMRVTQTADKYLIDGVITPPKIDQANVNKYMDLLYAENIAPVKDLKQFYAGRKVFLEKLLAACFSVRKEKKTPGLVDFEKAVEAWSSSRKATSGVADWITRPYSGQVTGQKFSSTLDPLANVVDDNNSVISAIRAHIVKAYKMLPEFETFAKGLLPNSTAKCVAKILDESEVTKQGTGFFRVLQKFYYGDNDEQKRVSEKIEQLIIAEYKGEVMWLESNVRKKPFLIKDLLRGQIEVKDETFVKDLETIKAAITKQGYKIAEIKNNLVKQDHLAYPSVFLIIEYKGVLSELQIVPVGVAPVDPVKDKISHLFYEIDRTSKNIGVFGLLTNTDVFAF